MIILLNYIPHIVFAIGGYFVYRNVTAKKLKPTVISVIVTLLALMLLNAITPSYMPKGTVRANTVPQFEATKAPFEHRLRQARSKEDHSNDLDKGLDWKQKAEKSKVDAETKQK